MALHTQPCVTVHSSDRELVKGFERIRKQALHWVFEGYPVGDYYEAALPNRDAFCMRDVSHQCIGGEVLGLGSHNKNMFTHFVQSISEARGYCGHWEIDRWNRSCPVDYKDDSDYWYDFPANFDVLCACWKMYEWTGDRDYIERADFDRFFACTMEQYIKHWDKDGDGIPEATGKRAGLATYDEMLFGSGIRYRYGSDLLASMACAYKLYAAMCTQLGRREQAGIYNGRGEALLRRMNEEWYDERRGYASAMGEDGQLIFDHDEMWSQLFLLYWNAVSTPARAQWVMDGMERRMATIQVESLSHYPELFWLYGRPESAMKSLRMLMDPACVRKEYPEASYCPIGAMATGLLGICPTATAQDAPEGRRIRTLSGLTDVEWVEMRQIPVLGGLINVRMCANTHTIASWEAEKPVTWRAAFHGEGTVTVDGAPVESRQMKDPFTGQTLTYADIRLENGVEKQAAFQAK